MHNMLAAVRQGKATIDFRRKRTLLPYRLFLAFWTESPSTKLAGLLAEDLSAFAAGPEYLPSSRLIWGAPSVIVTGFVGKEWETSEVG